LCLTVGCWGMMVVAWCWWRGDSDDGKDGVVATGCWWRVVWVE
jgi:hypothetical protein